MADIALLLEAEQRGILPPEKAGLLQEARSRGLVPTATTPTATAAKPAYFWQPGWMEQQAERTRTNYKKDAQWGMGAEQAAYEAGGKVTDISAKAGASPEVAGGLGYATNVGMQAVPALFGATGAPAAVRQAAQSVLPKHEVVALARKAQALDIPIRPDMLTDNKFARMLGEAFEKIPLAGSRTEARQVAFNRAVMSEIGADKNATRLTPDVFKAAMEKSGEKIGEIAKNTPITIDKEAIEMLSTQVDQAQKFLPKDIANVVENYVKELAGKAVGSGKVGVIDGETFRKINSQIGRQVRTSTNGDLRSALINLQDDMAELLKKNIANPEDLAALQTARKQYAIGSTVIPLVAKSPIGDISPSALMSAVTSTAVKKGYMARGGGEIGDLARIGQLFLKEPASSGTAERALVYGGGLGALAIEPTTAGAVYGGANLYNRLGPSFTNAILKLDPLR